MVTIETKKRIKRMRLKGYKLKEISRTTKVSLRKIKYIIYEQKR